SWVRNMRELNPLPLASGWHSRPLDQVLFVRVELPLLRAPLYGWGWERCRKLQEGAGACHRQLATTTPCRSSHVCPRKQNASQGFIGPLSTRPFSEARLRSTWVSDSMLKCSQSPQN